MNIKLSDLVFAMDFVSASPYENKAFLDITSGTIYWQSDLGLDLEELPEDIGGEHYLQIPSNHDFDLGKRLVMVFTHQFLPDVADDVQAIFRRKGAYAQFKSMLDRHDLLDQWHQFQVDAQDRALREWCEDNGIKVEDV